MRGKAERRYHKQNRVNLVSISIYGCYLCALGNVYSGTLADHSMVSWTLKLLILVVLQTESLIRHSTEGNGLIEPLRH